MRNILKATMGILAVIVFLGLDKVWASDYSIRDRSLNLTVVMDEVPSPSGQGTVIRGSFRNEANGVSGSINTFYKSDITGTQILEFSWVTDNCFGKYFVVPLWSKSSTAENIFQKSTPRKMVLNFIAGATCEGPLDKLKIEVGEGFYGTGNEENHVHVSNACPHKGQPGHQSSYTHPGQNGNNSGANNSGSGSNISVNVNNSNNGGSENNGHENNGKGNPGKGN